MSNFITNNLILLNDKYSFRSKFYDVSEMDYIQGVDNNLNDLSSINNYLKYISRNYYDCKYDKLPRFMINEINFFENNYFFAIYLILIFYKFCTYHHINLKSFKFYQGVILYYAFTDFCFADEVLNTVYYPFFTYDNSILDFAIYNEYVMLPNKFDGFVVGQAPPYIRYYGIEENVDILNKYYSSFFNHNKITNIILKSDINSWFENHNAFIKYLIT